MDKSGLKDPSNMKAATNYAHKSRADEAGCFDGGMPPSGPAKEPTRINKVPMIKESGVSKK